MPCLRRELPWAGLIVVAGIALCGCVVASDKPIYDARRDTIFDPAMLGNWRCASDEQLACGLQELRIGRVGSRRYRLTVPATQPSDAPPRPIDADLVPLGTYRYLFVVADGQTGTFLFPCYRVQAGRQSLDLWLLNVATIAQRLEKDPNLLQHRFVEVGQVTEVSAGHMQPTTKPLFRNIILTGPPAEIRGYLVRHQDDPDEFEGPIRFTKAPQR